MTDKEKEVKIVMHWQRNDDEVAFVQTWFRPLWRSGIFDLKSHILYLENLKSLVGWFVYDSKTNELLASKNPPTKQEQAKALYQEHNNYAKVAKMLNIHPTTARKWINDN